MRCIRAGQKRSRAFQRRKSANGSWRNCQPDERQSLQTLRASARSTRLPRIALVENQALNHAVAHVFERKSVVPEHELLNVALSHRLGAVDLNRFESGGEAFAGFGENRTRIFHASRFWQRNWI